MTTSAAIRTAFESVWSDSDIKAYTDVVLNYDAVSVVAESGKHEDVLKKDTLINAVIFDVSKIWQKRITQGLDENFRISIKYYKQADPSGAAYVAIHNFYETLFSTINDNLGDDLSGTVYFWQPEEETVNISYTEINNLPVWYGDLIINAFNKTSLT